LTEHAGEAALGIPSPGGVKMFGMEDSLLVQGSLAALEIGVEWLSIPLEDTSFALPLL